MTIREHNWVGLVEWLSTDKPIQTAYQDGTLEKYLPEVYCLFGVPQPEEHHPEIDTGVHTCMVLDAAKKNSNDPAVWFSALCHDLGKGLTPQSEWPKHLRHEENGLVPLSNVCERFNIPADVRRLAELTCAEHLKAHKSMEMRPGNIIQWIESHDWYSNEQELKNFLDVCEADALGRKGKETSLYYQKLYVIDIYNTTKQIMTLGVLDLEKSITDKMLELEESIIASDIKNKARQQSLNIAITETKELCCSNGKISDKIDNLNKKYGLVLHDTNTISGVC